MSLLSNIKFRIEGVLTTSGTSVKVSNDLELNGVITVDKASVVLHNSSKTSIERMECSFAGGIMTIIKRGLTQANTKIEDANLKKERRKGAYGYITLLASDQMDIDNSGEASNISTNQNFYGQVNSLYGYGNTWKNLTVSEKLGLPKFNNIGEVNAAIPNPTNELVIIAGDMWHYNDVTAQREIADTGTPIPNASTIAVGKVKIATSKNSADEESGVYNMPTISQINELIDDNITETQSSLTNSDYLAGETTSKGDSLFVEDKQVVTIGSPVTDTNTQNNRSTTASQTQALGMKITIANSIILNSITKQSTSTASRVLIKNSGGTILYTGSFSGNVASFTGTHLVAGTYRIECDNSGSSYTAASDNASTQTIGTNVTYVTGSGAGSDTSIAYNIDTINSTSIGYTDIANLGDIANNTRIAIRFIGSGNSGNSVTLGLAKVGSPSVSLKGRIEQETNGIPSGELFGQEMSIDPVTLSANIGSKSISFATTTEEFNNTDTLVSTGSSVQKRGIKIYIEETKGLTSITKHASCTATKCYLYNLQGQLITSATFSGNVATLNASVVAGEYYYIILDNSGSSYTNVRGSSASIIDLDGVQYLGGANLRADGNYSIDFTANSSSGTTDPIYTIGRDFTVQSSCYVNRINMATNKDSGVRYLKRDGIDYATSDSQGYFNNVLLEAGYTYTAYAASSSRVINFTVITPNGIISTATQGTGCSGVTSFSMDITGVIGTEQYRNNITKIILDDGIATVKGVPYRLVLYAGTYGSETINGANYFRLLYSLRNTTTRYGKLYNGTTYGSSDGKFYTISTNLSEQCLLSKTDADYIYKLPDIPRLAIKNYNSGELVKYDFDGITKVLSGLTPNSAYFISNTPGLLSTTSGTHTKYIGRSLKSDMFDISKDGCGYIYSAVVNESWVSRTGTQYSTIYTCKSDGLVNYKITIESTGSAVTASGGFRISADGTNWLTVKTNIISGATGIVYAEGSLLTKKGMKLQGYVSTSHSASSERNVVYFEVQD